MNNIIYDNELIIPENNKFLYYYGFMEKLNHRDCVKFALFCAKIVNNKSNKSNHCINLVEKWLLDEKTVTSQELFKAANAAVSIAANSAWSTTISNTMAIYAAYAALVDAALDATYITYAAYAADDIYAVCTTNIDIINKYLQVLLRKTKQFQNNKILEQISKTDVDKLELVDWNMITDIMQEEYNIVHEFNYEDIFSRRCLIELLRKEYI